MKSDFGAFKLVPVDCLPKHILSLALARFGDNNICVAVRDKLDIFLFLEGHPLFSWKSSSRNAAWSRFRKICCNISDTWCSEWHI